MNLRVAKRIAAEGIRASEGPADEKWAASVTEAISAVIRTSPLIEITVADHIACEGLNRNAGQMDLPGYISQQWPNVAPPFASYWMDSKGDPTAGGLGVAFLAVKKDGPDRGWRITAIPVICGPGLPPVCNFVITYDVTAEGGIDLGSLGVMHSPTARDDGHDRVVASSIWLYTIGAAWEAHKLLHCKNVGLREFPIEAPYPRRMDKRFGDRLNGYRYHVLTVRSSGGESHTLSAGDGDNALPLHVVRGHYKTFTIERPLFGKMVGTYFWSPFARGSSKNGVTDKDYRIGG